MIFYKKQKTVWISIEFVGDKGKRQIHSSSIQMNPKTQCLVVDWTNQEVDVYGRKLLEVTLQKNKCPKKL